MKTINEFIEKVMKVNGSDELHTVMNTAVAVADTFKQIADLPMGAELVDVVIINLSVSEDCIKEMSEASGQYLQKPSELLPYYWMHLIDGRFHMNFQTEKKR